MQLIDTSKNEMDTLAGDVLATIDALTDAEIDTTNGSTLYVHNINGKPNHQMVIGFSRKGKTIFAICPVCSSGFIEKK